MRVVVLTLGLTLMVGRGALAAEAPASEKPAAAPAGGKLAKIVFVGKKNACPCLRADIEAGWKELQRAVGKPAKVPVERLDLDLDWAAVDSLRLKAPFKALPAVYCLDGTGAVLELLEGEVTEAKVVAVLGR
jgi:hypothetical protein